MTDCEPAIERLEECRKRMLERMKANPGLATAEAAKDLEAVSFALGFLKGVAER